MFLDWAKTHSIHSGYSTRKALLLSVCPVTNLCWVVYLFRATQLAWPLWASLKEIPCPLTSIWTQPMASPSGDWRKEERNFSFLCSWIFYSLVFSSWAICSPKDHSRDRWGWGKWDLGYEIQGDTQSQHYARVWLAPESKVLVTQPCLTLCHLMDCSPPGSFVHGIQIWWLIPYIYLSFYWGDSVPYNQSSTDQNSEGTEVWEVAGEYLVVLNEIWILGPRSIIFWAGQAK